MRKYLLLTLAAAFCAINAQSAPITPEQALQRLGTNTRSGSTSLRLAYTTLQANGEAAVYVFNQGSASGYIFMSADDSAAPVLGYSENGSFDEKEMSPDMKWWLGEYGRQIEYARENGAPKYVDMATRASRKSIEPMIKTKWNQSQPYNNMTPEVKGKHCVTGCVATSTAQVMNFWKYPAIGKGEGTATVVDGSDENATVSMNFAEQAFDWENMLDDYSTQPSTQAQKNAVAYLMKACGYGAKMTYTSNESGTASLYSAQALVTNFGYNRNLQYCYRDYYSFYDWDDMIYDELAAGRPIIYGGASTEGGHSFVCDGYDGNGMYHFNWGWGGMSDGYFALNALNPGSLGIGANGGGYNFFQDIIRGIQPEKGAFMGTSLVIDGLMEGTMSGNTLTLKVPVINNMDAKSLDFALGVKIEPMSSTGSQTTYKAIDTANNMSLPSGFIYTNLNLPVVISTSLVNGTYKVTLCYKLLGETEWMPLLADQASFNYVLVTKNGTRYTVTNNKAINIEIEDGEVVGELAYGQLATIKVTVNNPSDRELTKSIYPVLCSGTTPVFKGKGITLDLDPGDIVTSEIKCLFELIKGASAPTADTTYRLRFYDPGEYTYGEDPSNLVYYAGFSKDVTMIKGENPKLVVTSFDLPGLEYETVTDGRFTYRNYSVTEPEITVSCSLRNEGGYYGNIVLLQIYKSSGSSTQMPWYAEGAFPTIANISKGGTQTLTGLFNNLELTDGQYAALLTDADYNFLKDTNGSKAEFYFEVNLAGVEEVIADKDIFISFDRKVGVIAVKGSSAVTSIEVYSLNGGRCNANVSLKGDEATAEITDLPGGVYVAKVTTSDGKSRTIKVVK